MKEYATPEIEIVEVQISDVITTSPGTETTPREDNGGIWALDIG